MLADNVRELENENYRLKNPSKQYEYNIGIYGVGELGGNTYLELQKISNEDTFSKINNLHLFGRTEEKPLRWAESNLINKEYCARTRTHSYRELPDIIENIDILIFSASQGNRLDLKENTKENLKLIRNISPELRDYKGLVIMASNQTDTLCYELAQKTSINPLRIVGVNSLDKRRYEAALMQHFSELNAKDIKAYVLGFHHNSIIIPSKTTINGLPLEELVSENELRKIDYVRKELTVNAVKDLGTTTQVTAPAIKKLVLAAMNENIEQTVSTVYKHNDSWLYMGLPVKFKDLHAIADYERLSRVPEIKELEPVIEKHIDFMKKNGIWQKGSIEVNYEERQVERKVLKRESPVVVLPKKKLNLSVKQLIEIMDKKMVLVPN